MALLDIKNFSDAAFGYAGDIDCQVAANTSGQGTAAAGTYIPAFRPGEIVLREKGIATVAPVYTTAASGTDDLVVGTDYVEGIATSTSTETDAAAGKVKVMKIVPGMSFLIKRNTTAWVAITTQALYDALVGDRVLLDLATGGYCSGVYTALATNGATYGMEIMDLDVTKYPGMVRFRFPAPVLSDAYTS